ncbi:WYL domain-containing protein [Herpetosiphon llansteffanensis]|uniref:WYL domain-containing protein n=1 Tax=Herpetosiphon llansteffanensis TaxID=2094568 RepID=UPI000D7D1793|nr:WYL domain-containing protein [Herpetosiphon llansteffanensis]
MLYSRIPVKLPVTCALARVSIRTLRTLAHYTHLRRERTQTRNQLAAAIQHHWATPAYRQLVRRSLTAADYELLRALWNGTQPLPAPETLDLWRWQAPWQPLASLSSLQRLAVLGLILTIRTPHARQTVLLRDRSRWLRRTQALPATPVPASLQTLFHAVAELLIQGSLDPQPATMPTSFARTLAQAAGWLVLRLDQWRTTPRGVAWLQASLTEQTRLLQQQIVCCSPPSSGLPAWRNPDWAGLWQALVALMEAQLPRRFDDVVALLWEHAAWGTLPDDQRRQLMRLWLRTVLQPAGVLSIARGWVFWHGWAAVTLVAPSFDGLLLPATDQLPPLLRWWAQYWGQATEHGWRLSVVSMQRRMHQTGDLTGFWEPLDGWYAQRPTAVAAALATVAARPPVRMRQVTLIEGSAEDLTAMEAQRGMRDRLQSGWTATQRVVRAGAEPQVAQAIGILPPQRNPPPADAETLVLALRIAAQQVPRYATAFQQQAQQLLGELTFEQRCAINEQWEAFAPQSTSADGLLAVGQQPPAPIPAEEARHAVRQAIRAGQSLTVRYYTPAAHRISRRTIRPLELTSTGVRGWCSLRQEERAFRFDRMLAIEASTN